MNTTYGICRGSLWAVVLVGVVALGNVACSKPSGSGEAAKAGGTTGAEAAKAEPKWVVNKITQDEFGLIDGLVRQHKPDFGPEPTQTPDETSVAFKSRHGQWRSKAMDQVRAFEKKWRFYCDPKKPSGAPCWDTTDLAKAIYAKGGPSRGWQCMVLDVGVVSPGMRSNGVQIEVPIVEIKCATKDANEWDYSVVGPLKDVAELKKGALIEFDAPLTAASAAKDDWRRLEFLQGSRSRLGGANNFTRMPLEMHVVGADQSSSKPGAGAASATTKSEPIDPRACPSTARCGRVVEVLKGGSYTYVRLATAAGEEWAAFQNGSATVGDELVVKDGLPMNDYNSTTLNKKFQVIYLGTRQ